MYTRRSPSPSSTRPRAGLTVTLSADPGDDAGFAELLHFAATAHHPHQPPYPDLITDYAQRRDTLRGLFAYEITVGREAGGELYVCDDHAGLALWVPCTARRGVPTFARDPRLAAALGDSRLAGPIAAFDATRSRARLTAVKGRDCTHLRLLTARFGSMDLAVETALLEFSLAALDARRALAYADPARPEIRDLLGRHGFAHLPGIPGSDEARAPVFYPMVREPPVGT